MTDWFITTSGLEHHIQELANICTAAVGMCSMDDSQPAVSYVEVLSLPGGVC